MNKINIKVNINTSPTVVDNYIDSIMLWCGANCVGEYSIKIIETEIFKIREKVLIDFKNTDDAAYFKLSPVWRDEITNTI